MTRPSALFRGTVRAAALVIDVPLIGEAEARHRVVTAWRPGTVVRAMPDGRWLVVLPEPVEIRSERAPGLPLAAGDAETVTLPSAGRSYDLRPADLPGVDLACWVDVANLPMHVLAPIQLPPPQPTALAPPVAAPAPDLRAGARVRRSEAAERVSRELGATQAGPRPAAGSPRARGILARLILRTPAAGVVGRRHARYLRRLTEEFTRRQWDDALRDAIALGGGVGGTLTLRLPSRRTAGLAPSARRTSAARSVPFGPNVRDHLRELYRQAATALEREGRIDEAAFVLADLLDQPAEAVALLERHRRFDLAAGLAEGRRLPADLAVRLWWRAGRRDRAVELARARGAFAAAVDRLATVDRTAARELRGAWVAACQSAQDHLGAVEAAWPEVGLRSVVIPDLQAGMALGGPTAATLFAYLVSHDPSPEGRLAALALLDRRDLADRPARHRFIAALAGLPGADKGFDRALCSAALRSLVRDDGQLSEVDKRTARRISRTLRERADPILAADLPPLWRNPVESPATVVVTAQPDPGQLAVHDAVALPGGAILVAHGDLGARLLTVDGRIRARWDVPAFQLVVADHGGSALLVARRGAVSEVHRLDLATRKVRPWATLAVRRFVPTFDGTNVFAVDADGIVVLDALGERPTAVWRELDREAVVYDIARRPDSLAALVLLPPVAADQAARLELWRWELPGIILRRRPAVTIDDALGGAITAAGDLVTLLGAPDGSSYVLRHNDARGVVPRRLPADVTPTIAASGDLVAVFAATEQSTTVEVATVPTWSVGVQAVIPRAVGPRFRAHAGLATIFDQHGRILVVDLADRQVVANLRTHL